MQYAVDFGRTADRIQMEADKAATLSACGGGMGAKTGLYCLPLNKEECSVGDKSFGFYPQMKAEGMAYKKDVSSTLVNGTNPGWQNGVVENLDKPKYIVRRLTPRECERLQGLPYLNWALWADENSMGVEKWYDCQRTDALSVVEKCLKKQKSAWDVEQGELAQYVKYVGSHSCTNQASTQKLVLRIVLINCEGFTADKLSEKVSQELAKIVGKNMSSLLLKAMEDFARWGVPMLGCEGKTAQHGKVELHTQEGGTMTSEEGGRNLSVKFGKEIEQLVNDAVGFTQVEENMPAIISKLSGMKKVDSTLAILSFFVQSVMRGFIQQGIRTKIILSSGSGYTDTEGATDSKRYKAVGNGMAKPCSDFVMGCVVKALME